MAFKITYLEDQAAESIISDLKDFDLDVEHCKPTNFKETIEKINYLSPDLLLMDFRLQEGGGEVDASPFAQYFRSSSVDDQTKSLPIVLLSNDEKIRDFHKDFTSQDLFDFSISKEKIRSNLEKYSSLMKELIESYRKIYSDQLDGNNLIELLNVPTALEENIDPRIKETLQEKRFETNVYMVSAFILGNIVKPVGILFGEDVLAARIGISKDSDDWDKLCLTLEDYKYKGIYCETYDRWWAEGFEIWWESRVGSSIHPRRLSSDKKLKIVQEKFPDFSLKKTESDGESITGKLWSICQESFLPIDPSEAFEIKMDLSTMPWIDRKYHSYNSIRDYDLTKKLTDFERLRFREIAREQ